jgi:hypothetical protein
MSTREFATANNGDYIFDLTGSALYMNDAGTGPCFTGRPETSHPVNDGGYPLDANGAAIPQPSMRAFRVSRQMVAEFAGTKLPAWLSPRKKRPPRAEGDEEPADGIPVDDDTVRTCQRPTDNFDEPPSGTAQRHRQ